MNVGPDWKRNLDALGSFLGPTGPVSSRSEPAHMPEVQYGSELLRELVAYGESGAPLDTLAERVGAKYGAAAMAAKTLEGARLIAVDWSAVVPLARLTPTGWQIARLATAPAAAG